MHPNVHRIRTKAPPSLCAQHIGRRMGTTPMSERRTVCRKKAAELLHGDNLAWLECFRHMATLGACCQHKHGLCANSGPERNLVGRTRHRESPHGRLLIGATCFGGFRMLLRCALEAFAWKNPHLMLPWASMRPRGCVHVCVCASAWYLRENKDMDSR